MKNTRYGLLMGLFAFAFISTQSCKTKKLVPKPVDTVATVPPPAPQKEPDPAPAPPPAPAPVTEKPDYNFSNIQFEFNSSILKTASYQVLDKAAAEMKKDPLAKFSLSGYASAEGTDAHNMSLSADRANAVKMYLINSGVSAGNLTAKGYGEANPVADNGTEAGKILNRRVEIKKAN